VAVAPRDPFLVEEGKRQPRPGGVQVLPDRVRGLAEQSCYFSGREAVDDERQHLTLSGRQWGTAHGNASFGS
jgi:hypothetical protein